MLRVALPVAVPVLAGLTAHVLPRRAATVTGLAGSAATAAAALAASAGLDTATPRRRVAFGGWSAPLGIEWVVDGLTAPLLGLFAIIGLAVSAFAWGVLRHRPDDGVAERFWGMWLLVWAGLHTLLLSADLFNLYVGLEIVSIGSAALIVLRGSGIALAAGTRYLLVAFTAATVYLYGVGLIYGANGELSLTSLSGAGGRPATVGFMLIVVGLLAKTGLFPGHFWLPGAHGSAPVAVSPLLSGLVVTATFALIVRLWLAAPAAVATEAIATVIGVLAVGAIVWGSLQALRQPRLKVVVAYSTVAQIGYLFLLLPLLAAGGGTTALRGGILYALAHGTAKAGMFMIAGALLETHGTDDLDRLRGAGNAIPGVLLGFGVSAVTLVGLPPTGGFAAKWLLIEAAIATGRWWWAAAMAAGSLLTAGYLVRVARILVSPRDPVLEPPSARRDLMAPGLALAGVALVLGPASGSILGPLDLFPDAGSGEHATAPVEAVGR